MAVSNEYLQQLPYATDYVLNHLIPETGCIKMSTESLMVAQIAYNTIEDEVMDDIANNVPPILVVAKIANATKNAQVVEATVKQIIETK
ncbi:hypothetical protein pVco7_gp055 [Vibrio phage pVco-7]|uniref:Uncharacterized protein n=1 Tax=Vibrio phage pVco-5 TaxID=1965485 RepID=A0A1W6JUU3_9CAUD|nr:hypothetical protein KNT61_gp056 [Vibrio phage pVco-5]ARM71044.1 hypothetical protein pVco5_056 [Vibrio phage pVco-5]